MKNRKIQRGKARVMKIGKDAVWELICEDIVGNSAEFFELPTGENGEVYGEVHIMWSDEQEALICAVCNVEDRKLVDLDKLADTVEITTDSVFHSGRYKTVSL